MFNIWKKSYCFNSFIINNLHFNITKNVYVLIILQICITTHFIEAISQNICLLMHL